MPFKRTAVLFIACACVAGCASGSKKGSGAGRIVKIDVASQSARILADARKKKSEKDCGAAIPSYRVVASFGKGHDTAQYELGACLLEATAETSAGEALLRDEGLFWLRRAAYAGNARAQLALAGALSGAESHVVAGMKPDLVEGYGWALIYADNAAHNLYGLPDLHPVAAEHFRVQMSDTMISNAHAFAADFRTLEMPVFTPPASAQEGRGASGARGEGRGDGQRRRRQP